MRKLKKIDCVAIKRKAQDEIYEETKGMSNDELIAYIEERVDKSPFGYLYRKNSSVSNEKKKLRRA